MYTVHLLNKNKDTLYEILFVKRFTDVIYPNTTLTEGYVEGRTVQRLDIIVDQNDKNLNLLQDLFAFVNDGPFDIKIYKESMTNSELIFEAYDYTEFSHLSKIGEDETFVYTISWSKQLN